VHCKPEQRSVRSQAPKACGLDNHRDPAEAGNGDRRLLRLGKGRKRRRKRASRWLQLTLSYGVRTLDLEHLAHPEQLAALAAITLRLEPQPVGIVDRASAGSGSASEPSCEAPGGRAAKRTQGRWWREQRSANDASDPSLPAASSSKTARAKTRKNTTRHGSE
jgi:hypothetical protein